MLRYIVVLVLVFSYRSFGVPVNPPPSTVARSLSALAEHCENAFLSTQIKNNIGLCMQFASPHDERQLQCVMFYDINMQLCSAVSTAKLALPDDYTTKIKEAQDINSMCSAAEHWVFSNLTEFPYYKQIVDKRFKSPVKCGPVCGVEDVTIDDSNFFCKYFKWGVEMLSQVSVSSVQKVINDNATKSSSAVDKPAPSEPNSDLQDVQIKNNSNKQEPTPSVTPIVNNEAMKTEENKLEIPSVSVNKQSQTQAPPVIPAANINRVEDTGPMPENAANQPSKAPEDIPKADPVQDESASKPEVPIDETKVDTLKSDVEKEMQSINSGKDPVLEGPQVKLPNDDDLDAEEGKEGMPDSQGGDDDDDETLLGDFDARPDVLKTVKKEEPVAATFNEEGSNKIDYYNSNPGQDLYAENEDHFFPFFLTAVILVILLYVLYHNKNKVGKVFFGLVLEGRNGRRRNSRGHSYRRLDTLEQAMSDKTAAPPSKIIY